MIYNINGKLLFNDADYSLRFLQADGDVESSTLPRAPGLLLKLMVEHNNMLLSREFLLQEIWDNNGLVGSGNNLNNTVSILRRKLAFYDQDMIIKTIPKEGFLASIEHLCVEDDMILNQPAEEEIIINQPVKAGLIKLNNGIGCYFILSAFLFFFVALSFLIKSYHMNSVLFKSRIPVDGMGLVGVDNECVFYAKNRDIDKENIILRYHIDCTVKNKIYVYEGDSERAGGRGYSFVAGCSKNKRCVSYSSRIL
jgi:DNA-binding winged helix-turn-helix (wHTH) protein